ncbi:hypothetical protein MAC_05320 [Metarhizium acridum CQMa 102]|uniref:Uncharacterized protein n=1 Tax=Metarhizium acridum (strain CQMa 102) TaxID=655827 RepID=E9E622_METAQ|nr:uncharacterized protein MAC_05320 [Metarhizium acridum CQMa 102]EFY88702.1 hypothetical protein MAC_05320 [Metarhizium acridum CQMa 102]
MPEFRRPCGHWLYLPVNDNEWISEVWVRSKALEQSTLILVTNSKRTLVMEAHPRNSHRFSYELVAKLSNEPSLFYLDLRSGLQEIRCGNEPPVQDPIKTKPDLLEPTSTYPQCLPTEFFYFSTASLEDVSEIKLCKDAQRISGVVLGYSDGREVSLGWVHPDHLSSPMKVDDSLGMWLLVSETGLPLLTDIRLVTDIRLTVPMAEAQKYFAVQWRGQLGWWFSVRQCQLHHEGEKHEAN